MTPDYGFRVTVAPTAEPVSLLEAKEHARVSVNEDDGLIAGYILAARRYAEAETGLLLMPQTVEMTLDAFPTGPIIELARAPVQSISSVNYADSAGADQVWPSSGYVLDAHRHRPALRLAYGESWPAARSQPNAVTITFVAGFAEVNAEWEQIRQAMLLLIGHWYEHREVVVVGSTVNEVPLAVTSLLCQHRINWL